MKSKVTINQGRIIKGGFRFSLSLLCLLGMLFAFLGIQGILGFLVMVFCAILLMAIWTSIYLLEIDPDKHVFFDGFVIFGKRFGQSKTFAGCEYVFINTANVSQIANSWVASMTTHHREYVAYLKTSDNLKLFLASSENEQDLRKRLSTVLKKLNTSIRPS